MKKKTILAVLLAALCIRIAVPIEHHPTPVAPDVQKDINCLAENVYYEARGESDDGKKAVAEVTTNRASTPGFPNTVCGVVHQKTDRTCQFSWVCQRHRPPIDKKDQTWVESKNIATDVLLFDDNPGIMKKKTALFYHADYVKPGWARHMKFIKRIGGHLFYTKK
jgi:spore germination cell wall hydrolase CwlJ-like protein